MITINQSSNQKHINICFQAVAIHLQKRKKESLLHMCTTQIGIFCHIIISTMSVQNRQWKQYISHSI